MEIGCGGIDVGGREFRKFIWVTKAKELSIWVGNWMAGTSIYGD